MTSVKQSDEIQEYCAHGLNCTNQHTWCQRWHTGGICFFSMCYDKPFGSGHCFNGDDCKSEHPTHLNDNIWLLKSGKTFYFQDPKYKLYLASESASKAAPKAKPEVAQEPTEHKKSTRAEKKAARKAARKSASAEAWANMDSNDNEPTEDTKHNTDNVPKEPTKTMVDMSTKSSWVAKVKAGEQHIKPHAKADEPQAKEPHAKVPTTEDFPELKAGIKAEKLYMQQSIETQAAMPTTQQATQTPTTQQATQTPAIQPAEILKANENKFSSELQDINKNFLEDDFDPVRFESLRNSLQAEFERMTVQIKLLQEQTIKLHRLQKAHAGYHAKE